MHGLSGMHLATAGVSVVVGLQQLQHSICWPGASTDCLVQRVCIVLSVRFACRVLLFQGAAWVGTRH
jgi:hypothetical protein